VVDWPSGLHETWRNVAANAHLTLVEGSTLTGAPAVGALRESLRVEPNPSRDSVTIRWAAAGGGGATYRILDPRGRAVRTVSAPSPASGWAWDGRDDAGRPVAAGTYFVVARRGTATQVGRITRIR